MLEPQPAKATPEAVPTSPVVIALPTQSSATFKKLAEVCTAISALAIPIVLAVVGYFIQKALQQENLDRDYVQLAVSVLKEPKLEGQDPNLRVWAVGLLNAQSPLKFSNQVATDLKNGTLSLPRPANERALAIQSSAQTQAFRLAREINEFVEVRKAKEPTWDGFFKNPANGAARMISSLERQSWPTTGKL